MSTFDTTKKIKSVNPHADIDSQKGPYGSVSEALDATRGLREPGRTVKIITGGTTATDSQGNTYYTSGDTTEYWFKSGIEDSDLVVKITGSSGGGNTNLTYTASSTEGIINSDTGTDATIPLATTSNAGLLSPGEKVKLNNTTGSNNGDNAPNSNSNAYTDAAIASVPSAPDATTTIKGKVKLAGDLSGTADVPTVPALTNKANISGQIFTGNITATNLSGTNTGDNAPNTNSKAYTDSAVASIPGVSDATTTTKGIIKLAGDLAGTADLPTVPALTGKANISGQVFTGAISATNLSGTNTGDNSVNTNSNAYTNSQIAAIPKDATPTAGSTNTVTSQGVKTYVDGKIVAFQPETKLYTDRMAAVGNIIDYQSALAFDDFVTTGKRDGWFSSIKFFAPMYGYNLAGALVKFVVDAGGVISMGNTGLTDTNYIFSKGLSVVENNVTKYFASTGFIPSDNGLSSNNMFIGHLVNNYDAVLSTGSGHLYSDSSAPSSDDAYIAGTNKGAILIGTRTQNLSFSGRRQMLANAFSANYFSAYLNGENQTNDRSITATAVTLNTEITIFKSRRFGSDLWMRTATISYLIAGSGLTNPQAASLNKALYRLYERLGRLQTQGSLFTYFGDSNTAGISADSGADRFSVLASAALGGIEFNVGVPSSQLRLTVASLGITGGYQRYQALLNKDMNTLVIMYGTNDMNVGDGTTNGDATIIADLRTKLQEIVVAAKAKGIRVILITPPFVTATSTTVTNTTKQLAYNAAVALVAKNTSVPIVDAYTVYADKPSPSDFYAVDGLHMNSAGHLLLAKLLVSVANGKAYREVNLDLPSIPAGESRAITVPMLNLVQFQTVIANYPTWTALGLMYRAESTSDGIATITVYNPTNATVDAPTAYGRIEANLN